MRALRLASLVLAFPVASAPLALAAGCTETTYVSCTTGDDCLQGSIRGTCVPSPASEMHWCGFPDGTCTGSGLRWGVKSGDGLASECVPGSGPDAGLDAAPPGSPDAMTPACDVTKPFAPATEVLGLHAAGANDVHGSLTQDELTIYFASDRLDPSAARMHLYSATRVAVENAFDAPRLLNTLSSEQGESNPSVSPDGNTIYFDSFRISQGTVHIFTSTRGNAAVAFPSATMIAGDYLIAPSITADGNVLYAANLQDAGLARFDRVGGQWSPSQPVAISAPGTMTSPVSRDDLTLFMTLVGTTKAIMVTKRASTSASFPSPTEVTELTTSGELTDPSWISPDGCRLYLRYQPAGEKSRIYVATRPK
jgi:Tol biopolymer transport system component